MQLIEHQTVSAVNRCFHWAVLYQLSSLSITHTDTSSFLCSSHLLLCLFIPLASFCISEGFLFSNETYLFVYNRLLIVAALMFCSSLDWCNTLLELSVIIHTCHLNNTVSAVMWPDQWYSKGNYIYKHNNPQVALVLLYCI